MDEGASDVNAPAPDGHIVVTPKDDDETDETSSRGQTTSEDPVAKVEELERRCLRDNLGVLGASVVARRLTQRWLGRLDARTEANAQLG
jgi:hypothetical protein